MMYRVRITVCVLLLAVVTTASCGAAPPAAPPELLVRLGPSARQVVVQLSLGSASKLPAGQVPRAQGSELLSLRLLTPSVDGTADQVGPPLLGSYDFSDGHLSFRPRYDLTPGLTYLATGKLGEKQLQSRYTVPEETPSKAPQVVRVFPQLDRLPANLLKFYIEFDAPMREGKAIFDQIHLYDEDGREIEAPWRRVELWNPEGTRLTLWIHPGRIKTGVNLNTELGPVLHDGRSYRLWIDGSVRSQDGVPLAEPFEKPFLVLPAVRTRVEADSWKILPPQPGARSPLTVQFPRPMDHSLCQRLIRVSDADGQTMVGAVSMSTDQRTWQFVPPADWKAGEYRLQIDADLEDLAGNTPRRVFDRDLEQGNLTDPVLSRTFRVE